MKRGLFLPTALLFAVLLSFSPTSAQRSSSGDLVGLTANGFSLEQAYVNPFNPETRIPFVLGKDLFGEDRPVRVTIQVVDLLQQFVATPTTIAGSPIGEGIPVEDLEFGDPGRYEVVWDGKNLKGAKVASGTYFVRLRVGDLTRVMKVFFPGQ
jgi:hypothetical protein